MAYFVVGDNCYRVSWKKTIHPAVKNKIRALGRGFDAATRVQMTTAIEDATSQTNYGVIQDTVIAKNVANLETLEKVAQTYADEVDSPIHAYTIQVIDTYRYGRHQVGDQVRLEDSKIGLNDTFRIFSRRMDFSVQGGEDVFLTLANKRKTLEQIMKETQHRSNQIYLHPQTSGTVEAGNSDWLPLIEYKSTVDIQVFGDVVWHYMFIDNDNQLWGLRKSAAGSTSQSYQLSNLSGGGGGFSWTTNFSGAIYSGAGLIQTSISNPMVLSPRTGRSIKR